MGKSNIERDKETVRLMVSLYCKHKLGLDTPTPHYQEVAEYACKRLDLCRYGEGKPACKDCKTHCYRPGMAEEMRAIMRWAGPRMPIYSPAATARHLWQTVRHCFKAKTS